MDRAAGREAAQLIATLIGELMEDHVVLSLVGVKDQPVSAPRRLQQAGEDIATPSSAIAVIARRSQLT